MIQRLPRSRFKQQVQAEIALKKLINKIRPIDLKSSLASTDGGTAAIGEAATAMSCCQVPGGEGAVADYADDIALFVAAHCQSFLKAQASSARLLCGVG